MIIIWQCLFLRHEAKAVLGQFFHWWNKIGWSGHIAMTIRKKRQQLRV